MLCPQRTSWTAKAETQGICRLLVPATLLFLVLGTDRPRCRCAVPVSLYVAKCLQAGHKSGDHPSSCPIFVRGCGGGMWSHRQTSAFGYRVSERVRCRSGLGRWTTYSWPQLTDSYIVTLMHPIRPAVTGTCKSGGAKTSIAQILFSALWSAGGSAGAQLTHRPCAKKSKPARRTAGSQILLAF